MRGGEGLQSKLGSGQMDGVDRVDRRLERWQIGLAS